MNNSITSADVLNIQNSTNMKQESFDLISDKLRTTISLIYTLMILFNFSMCCISLLIFHRDQQSSYKSRTFVLLKLLFANDLLLSTYMVIISIWHAFINGLFGFDEIHSNRTCFLVNSPQVFFIKNNCFLTLLISLDRFSILTKKPLTITADYNASNVGFMSTMLILLVLSTTVCVIGFFQPFDSTPVLHCTLKASMSKNFATFTLLISNTLMWSTLFVYLALIVLNQLNIFKMGSPNDQPSIATLKLTKRLSRVLAYSTLIYFLLGPLSSMTLLVLYQVLPAFATSFIAAILGAMAFLEGSFFTLSLLAMKVFRDDFRKLVAPNLQWFQNRVGVGLNVNQNNNHTENVGMQVIAQ